MNKDQTVMLALVGVIIAILVGLFSLVITKIIGMNDKLHQVDKDQTIIEKFCCDEIQNDERRGR